MITSKDVLRNSMWMTGTDGAICSTSEGKSVADELDVVNQKLSASLLSQSTVCCLNANMDTVQIPWSFGRNIAQATQPPSTIEALVLEIFLTQWESSHIPMRLALRQMRTPDRPIWQPHFPTQPTAVEAIPDISIRWLHKAPPLEKLLGSRDLRLYIEEPFTQRPVMEVVRIIDVTQQGSGYRRIATITSSKNIMDRVREQYQTSVQGINLRERQWQGLLCAVLNMVKADVTQYIEETCKRIDESVCIPWYEKNTL
jgi:hypothetical protein